MLQVLDTVQLNYIRVHQKKSVADKANFAALSKLPDITVSKLRADNYGILTTSICSVIGRPIGMNAIPIDYVMRGVTGNYDYPWTNREDTLNNCLLHTGNYFKNDNITLYLIYYQYIGTEGVGSNIINTYHSKNNGRKCHQDLELQFHNDSYLTNKATAATSTTNSAVYNGDRRKFNLETHYTIISKYFNALSAAGSTHAFNNMKKINAFEQRLKDPQAIHWCIISKERWDNLPPVE